jgi:hypothetical protein
MLTEWSAECAADDPVLVVPWADPSDPNRRFIDLREDPYELDHLEEAAQYPALMHALRALNATRSPVFTAKCDAWPIDPGEDQEDQAELAHLRLNLDLIPEESPSGFASYIDLLWRERSIFASVHRHEQILDRLTRLAAPLDHPHAMIDCVIRPALVDLAGPQEGFAVSLYIKALGHDQSASEQNWATALEAAVALLRSRAFSLS